MRLADKDFATPPVEHGPTVEFSINGELVEARAGTSILRASITVVHGEYRGTRRRFFFLYGTRTGGHAGHHRR